MVGTGETGHSYQLRHVQAVTSERQGNKWER